MVYCDWACICLAPLWRYGASTIMGSRPWPLESRDVIGHMTIWLVVGHLLWAVHCHDASIWHRYGDMKPQSWTLVDGRMHARTLRWLYTLSNAMHCIGQTIMNNVKNKRLILHIYSIKFTVTWTGQQQTTY